MTLLTLTNPRSLGPLTGKGSASATLERFGVGGCDLGYPVYDEAADRMWLLFGDTFDQADFNDHSHEIHWRSGVFGILDNFSKKKDFTIDRFYCTESDAPRASAPYLSHHLPGFETTKIPTGGIVVNGVFYFFNFNITSWDYPNRQKFACGSCFKYDEKTNRYLRVFPLTWVNGENPAKETVKQVIQEDDQLALVGKIDLQKHLNPFFSLVYPFDDGDNFIYLFGQGSYRESPTYVARLRKSQFESFETIEYLVGFLGKEPVWEKAPEAIGHLYPLLQEGIGEMSLLKIEGRYLLMGLEGWKSNLIYYQSESLLGPYSSRQYLLKGEDPLLEECSPYAPMSHTRFYDPKTKELKVIVSKWLPAYNPITLVYHVERKTL